jgi:hypothetical protein
VLLHTRLASTIRFAPIPMTQLRNKVANGLPLKLCITYSTNGLSTFSVWKARTEWCVRGAWVHYKPVIIRAWERGGV